MNCLTNLGQKENSLGSAGETCAHCYETFYIRNLLMLVISYSVFVPAKPFLPSLMFSSKAGAYQKKVLFRCATLGEFPCLSHKN